MRIKSKDVAEALGLSTATVSLAINGKPGVNEVTRQRVLDYVEEMERETYGVEKARREQTGLVLFMNYNKNGIILGRSDSAGELTQNGKTEHPLLAKMRVAVQSAGYRFESITFYEREDDLERLMRQWQKEKLRGMYVIGAEMTQNDIYPFLELGVPVVVGDNNYYEQGLDAYLIDNREGISRAVDYLVDKGHSYIVYLAEKIDIFNFQERREAFVLEMAKRECGDASNRIMHLGNTVDEVYESMLNYLNSDGRRPTAFVLESSVISLGVTKALLEYGLRIPRDISLIGFDALPEKGLVGFHLTLVKGTHTNRHLAAVKHLLRHIEDEETEIVRTYYKTRLIEGDSVFDKMKYIY